MKFNICVANESYAKYAEEICNLMYVSAQERGTGIAKRTPEYIISKINAGKSVIALAPDGEFAGYSYIESWGHSRFVATSGLIVAHKFRQQGLAKQIKQATFALARKLFPEAKIFSITTGLAVMKINTEMGFKPVPFSELTDDPEFWAGCQGCRNYDILIRNNYKMCLCTGLLYDPAIEEASKKKNRIKRISNGNQRSSARL
ncbi:MAG: GNAT family N-acetyltransferase [Bacteroidales bacterium]|jgi:GNAT superfamily N-acetyltransferase|nr:GNAT family N-acetyltransferase [Bacteroidales bacterium]MCI2121782.1 GNAT family N-acetyltransferase [Bacteroidales bacterium]MCI2146013.1 GNAT family N-acetyltransferase [Bacteroidales bacterium]